MLGGLLFEFKQKVIWRCQLCNNYTFKLPNLFTNFNWECLRCNLRIMFIFWYAMVFSDSMKIIFHNYFIVKQKSECFFHFKIFILRTLRRKGSPPLSILNPLATSPNLWASFLIQSTSSSPEKIVRTVPIFPQNSFLTKLTLTLVHVYNLTWLESRRTFWVGAHPQLSIVLLTVCHT